MKTKLNIKQHNVTGCNNYVLQTYATDAAKIVYFTAVFILC